MWVTDKSARDAGELKQTSTASKLSWEFCRLLLMLIFWVVAPFLHFLPPANTVSSGAVEGNATPRRFVGTAAAAAAAFSHLCKQWAGNPMTLSLRAAAATYSPASWQRDCHYLKVTHVCAKVLPIILPNSLFPTTAGTLKARRRLTGRSRRFEGNGRLCSALQPDRCRRATNRAEPQLHNLM